MHNKKVHRSRRSPKKQILAMNNHLSVVNRCGSFIQNYLHSHIGFYIIIPFPNILIYNNV